MLDFVVSGSRGFIGSNLVRQLRAAGFQVASDREFAECGERARVFVNCANIASSPSASLDLLSRQIALAAGRSEIFVQTQSFSTLLGSGEIATHRFNCGMRPALLNVYAAGKLEQERMICARLDPPFVSHVVLMYLPAVLGEGGAWDAVLKQARAHGFRLPRRMSDLARANWIDIADVGSALIALHRRRRLGAVERIILNRPEAERLTWTEFLSGSPSPAAAPAGGESAKSRIKEAVLRGIARAIAVAARSGLLLPADRLWRKFRPVAPAAPGAKPEIQPQPVRFGPFISELVANQPYIHGWR